MAFPLRLRRVPFIPQMEINECGAACLAMVLAHHGHHGSLAEVRQACGVSRDGATALALIRAARQYGLESEGAQVEPSDLHGLPLPAILHWDFAHFVVLERASATRFDVVDPATGPRRIGAEELARHFTGVVLCFAPGDSFRRRPRGRPSLARYRRVFLESLPGLLQILAASLALQLVGLVLPVANQLLVDRVVLPHQEAWLWGLAFGLGGAVLGRALLTLVRSYVIQGIQAALDLRLLAAFLDHLLRLPLAFFLQRHAGDLAGRARGSTAIRVLLGSQAVAALLDGLLLLAYAALMLVYDAALGLVVIGVGLARVVLYLAVRRRNQQLLASELNAGGLEDAAIVEALSDLEATKASGAESRMVQRWGHRMASRVNHSLERRRLDISGGQGTTLLQGLATAAVLLIGGEAVLAQRMTLGTFASFLALQGLFLVPFEALLTSAGLLQLALRHLARLDDVLETAPEPSGLASPVRLRGEIELREVSFAYGPGAPEVLHRVSLRAHPGEKVAIVGSSGSGKSTLAQLLLGMHRPTEGRILLDGRELADHDLPWVRRQLGVVLQDTFLFDDTVRANLTLHDDALPLQRLRAAAAVACVDGVIEALPGAYGGRVGENGSLLSGGQRQRLSLARALAHDPAVLVLDEATSSLDLQAEQRLHANLAALRCTRVVIAHRIATVRDADRILVLEGGRLVQEGSYRELVSTPGPFQRLARAAEGLHG